MTLRRELEEELERWEAAGLRRDTADGRRSGAVDFRSNDYLGLAGHPELASAARDALERHGTGARAARLLGGGIDLFDQLEEAVAEWLGSEAALLYPSGYQANLGVLGALARRGDAIFSDRANHASLIDAARLSRARIFVHRHCDLDELERQLDAARGARRRIVVTESVFSMDGDAAPLAELHELCARHDAWLFVDEAHAVGVVGPEGAGSWSALAHAGERLVARTITGGKALGVSGALVACDRALRATMLHRSRSFLFTTAPPPATAGALLRAVELVRAADEARTTIRQRADFLANALDLPDPAAGIVPVPMGDPARAMEAVGELAKSGFEVGGARPPTVPAGTSRLRIACHATHSEADVAELAQLVNALRPEASAPIHLAEDRAPTLFVVGTDTGIGKTVVSALLLRAALRRGPARYWKPVQTGDDDDTTTVSALADIPDGQRLRPVWALPLPASPHTAATDAGVEIHLDQLEQSLAGLRRTLFESLLIVELAGGLLVPYDDEGATQADWLERGAFPLVVVARSGLGTLNHTQLTLEALRARHLEPRALFLVGEPHAANRATLEAQGRLPAIFEVPQFESLGPDALDSWLDQNDLATLFEGKA